MENSNNSRGRDGDGDRGCVGFPAHSQVIKIRQEFEKIKHTSPQQLEKRGVISCRIYRQRSRSPLGLAERPISGRGKALPNFLLETFTIHQTPEQKAFAVFPP
ncbi:hypothetical protein NC652_025525 [Populus alba x Populus x berolinensis]|nr:hypothetical protein NC652_025525 [Populus alba x Populus x berolinensis]